MARLESLLVRDTKSVGALALVKLATLVLAIPDEPTDAEEA